MTGFPAYIKAAKRLTKIYRFIKFKEKPGCQPGHKSYLIVKNFLGL
jgi:hypothetical protein